MENILQVYICSTAHACRKHWRVLLLLLLLLGLGTGCRGELSLEVTQTPESDCLTPVPDEEISALYPKQTDLWPIEDCHEAYAAARMMTGVGHVHLTEVTQIISVKQGQAKEVPSLYSRGDAPIWRVVLRGRMVFEFPPAPPGSPTPAPPQPAYGCMAAVMLADIPNYSSVRTIECPPHPYLSPAP